MLVGGANAHRDLGPQLETLGADPAAAQPLAKGAGDNREHDVVDGAAEGVLHPLEVVEVAPDPREPAVRPDLDVQRHLRRRVGEVPAHLAHGLHRVPDLLDRALRMLHGALQAADGSHRRPRDVLDALGEQGGRRRLGLRSPGVVGLGGSGTGLRSNRTVAMSTPDTPSTTAWCVFVRSAKRFRVRPCTSHSSQRGFDRSSCWEKTRAAIRRSWSSEPGAGSAECRTWYSRLKVGIVDPEGPARLRRRIGQLLAEAGDQVMAALDVARGGPRSWAAGPRRS